MRSFDSPALAARAVTLSLLVTCGTAVTQDGQLPPARTSVVRIEVVQPAIAGRDIPQSPDAMYQGPPKIQSLVPEGAGGLAQPDSPETVPASTPPSGLDAPGDFEFFYNVPARPSGASVSQGLVEPTATIHRDVAFYTGNSFAALSRDSGQTWTHVNPSTRFAALDGGFCCDQRVLHVPNIGLTLWLLEYRYSASTGTGSLRIAFTASRDDLRDDQWASFTVNPQTFGFGTDHFLDFSDLSYSTTHLYGSAIVARSSNNTAASLVLWRARLTDVANGGNLAIAYYTAATLGGYGNYRFAQGAASTMYWAAHHNTSHLRVFEWPDSSASATVYLRTVPTWGNGAAPAPGPDGRDWTAFSYTRNTVLAGFRRSASEVGFMWTSGPVSGRPMMFVRVCRFDPTNSMSLLGTSDIWSNGTAWHFPSAAVNTRGDVGGTMCFGGGHAYPSVTAFIIDQYRTAWAPLQHTWVRSGQMGPASNRWGDYFHAERNSNYPETFVGTGFTRRSGGSAEPRYVWFGREATAPNWIALAVQSSPSGASISVAEADRLGRIGGLAPFTREYPRHQAYTLTAQSTLVLSGTTWLFDRWRYRLSPTGGYVLHPVGDRVLEVDGIGAQDDTAIAVYGRRRTLSVGSSNPSSGVPITVTPLDLIGRGSGPTSFSRYYLEGQTVSLTAPASVGYNPFRHWNVGGVIQPGGRSIQVVMTGDPRAMAIYYENVAGSALSKGSGCFGSPRLVPVHTVTWPSGQRGPQQGTPTTYRLRDARGRAAAALNVGLSNRWFNGLRLPLDLGSIGMHNCTLYHDIVSSQSLTTTAFGTAAFPVTWPAAPAAVGVPTYSSFLILDPGAPRRLPATMSQAMITRVGGNR